MKNQPRLRLLLLSLLVLSGLLSACGSTTNTAGTSNTVAATSSSAGATPTSSSMMPATMGGTMMPATMMPTMLPTMGDTMMPATMGATMAATAATGDMSKPLIIGMVTSKTGPLTYYGEMSERGFMIGLDYFTKGTNKIAGREVKVIVEDDAGDANKAVEAARKLVQQSNAEILVGTPSSTSALAIAAVNAKELKRIFVIDPAASSAITGDQFNQYTFRTGRNTDQDAAAGASFAASIATKSKKIASIFQDYAFGQDSNKSWKEVATKTAGIEWIDIAVPTSATDFTPYIQKVLDAAPDVLLVSWAGATAPKLYQQMKDNDLYSKVTVTGGVAEIPTIKAFGDAILGFQGMMVYWHQFPKNAENDYLVQQYKAKFQTVPDLFSPGGFSAASAIFAALTKTAGDTTPEKMIATMEGMSFPTPKGTMTFRKEDHQALQPMYIVKMIKDPTGTFPHPIPMLVREISAQESAPPIRRK